MEMKSKVTKFGVLSQAVLASTIGLMSMGASMNAVAAIQDTAVTANVNTGEAVYFTGAAGQIITLEAASVFGLPVAADIAGGYPAGYSMITENGSQGILEILGNAVAGTVIAPGSLGQAADPLERINFKNVGVANAGGVIVGEVFADVIDFTATTAVTKVTFKNNITSSGAIDFIVNIANELTLDTTNNDITVNATGIDNSGFANGTLHILGATGHSATINAPIGATNALTLVDTAGNGTVNISNNISATNINITNTSTLNVNENDLTFTGDVALVDTATLNLNNNKLNTSAAFTMGAGKSTLKTEISDATSTAAIGGGLIFAGGAITTAAANLVSIEPIGYLTQGGTKGNPIQLMTGGAAHIGVLPTLTNSKSAVLDMALAVNAANNIQLNVVRRAYDSGVHGLNDQAAGLGGALESDGAAGRLAASNPDMELFVGAVDSLATSADVAYALSTAAPTVNSSIVSSAHEVGERVLSNLDKRITLVRNGEGNYNTGMSAGDSVDGWGVWGEFFGSDFKQKKRNNIEGYDGNLWGATLGVDWEVDSATILGLAATYGTTDIDQDLAGNTMDIDSFQGSLYGSFHCNPWYVQGMLGLGHHKYDQTRNIFAGAARVGTALADYKAWEWLANAEAGYIYKSSEWNIIPSASLRYSHLAIDEYTERGAGGHNLKVNNEDVNAFLAGLGIKVQYDSTYGDSRIVPEAHFNAYYDFIADRQEATSNIFGTGTAFKSKGFDPAHDSYELGIGLNLYTARNSIFSINYDYGFKSDFHSHNGFVKLRYQW